MKRAVVISLVSICVLTLGAWAQDGKALICDLGERDQLASTLKVKEGQPAPDFTLESVAGGKVSLHEFRGKKNVVISFVPAAWTSVCSSQWPRYGGLQDAMKTYDAVMLGISVDNKPTLSAWTNSLGNIWFTVLSDFWPHGETASKFGVLRSDGMAERAIFVIDKEGVIQYARVHKIKEMPEPSEIITVLERIVRK